MKKALLCVSFGTSVAAARESITAVERVLKDTAADRVFARAFTSPTIRRILAKRGEETHSVAEALQQLLEEGVTDVLVQPTHILYGYEYDKMREELVSWRGKFEVLTLGQPLLAGTEDIKQLAAVMAELYPAKENRTTVLFGHGTEHFANATYPALQMAFHLMGREDLLVGTVEGWPAFEDVAAQLAASDRKKVHLVPAMLVAGDHAMNDMAGEDEDSWKSRLESLGYEVSCTMQGMGMLKPVQEMYRHRLEKLL